MIHFLGLTLTSAQALVLGAGLGSATGFGLGWLVRDYRAWSEEQGL